MNFSKSKEEYNPKDARFCEIKNPDILAEEIAEKEGLNFDP